jgi:drug/metabolite transporter (DMT)-like permease
MGYLFALVMVIFTAAGHLTFKHFAVLFKIQKPYTKNIGNLINPYFAAGLLLFAAAPLFYFKALETLELSTAFSLTAVNQIIIPLSGLVFFKEIFNIKKISGIILIAAGILIWNI